jgi:flagellar protein FliS
MEPLITNNTIALPLDAGLALSRIGFTVSAPRDTVPASSANTFTRAAIESASPQTLVVMLYQRLGLDVTRAVAAIKAGHSEESNTQITHAAQIVDHLRSTLNEEVWSDATSLLALYQYLLESFSRAQTTQDASVIEPCVEMIKELTDAWAAVAK